MLFKLKSEKKLTLNNLEIDDQLVDRIFKFLSVIIHAVSMII